MYKPPECNVWIEKNTLIKMGYLKLVQREDEKQAAMAGLQTKQLTQPGVEKHLAAFGVDAESASHTQISQLSGGMKVKIVLAATMWQNPHILILDEPTNGLDPEQTQHMRSLIRDIAENATVILSTHIMQEVDALCSRVLMLHSGKLALDAQMDEIRASNSVLVESTLDPARAKSMENLSGVASISLIATADGSNTYRVTTNASAELKNVSAGIANEISHQKEALFLLKPELRDLETLFREVGNEVSEVQEVEDAA